MAGFIPYYPKYNLCLGDNNFENSLIVLVVFGIE